MISNSSKHFATYSVRWNGGECFIPGTAQPGKMIAFQLLVENEVAIQQGEGPVNIMHPDPNDTNRPAPGTSCWVKAYVSDVPDHESGDNFIYTLGKIAVYDLVNHEEAIGRNRFGVQFDFKGLMG